MSEGLRRVAKICGGLKVTDARGNSATYNADGNRTDLPPENIAAIKLLDEWLAREPEVEDDGKWDEIMQRIQENPFRLR